MLKKRDLNDCQSLYELMVHPDVFPFVRHKAHSYEEFLFVTKQTMEAEDHGEIISRTILDEWGNPIGTINLFDVQDQAGFLGTWLGKPFHGKGYNQIAKEAFFNELFFELNIERIFMRIRKINIRSIKVAENCLMQYLRMKHTKLCTMKLINMKTYMIYTKFQKICIHYTTCVTNKTFKKITSLKKRKSLSV